MKTKQLTIAILTFAAALTACNRGSKNQIPDGWVIKNEVKNIETVDIEQIAEAIEVIPIAADEPIDEIQGISGSSNDFIASNGRRQTFYHIRDGRLIGKLNAVGNGPNEYRLLYKFSYQPEGGLFYGYNNSKGEIMCFQTSPFEFVSKSPINIHPFSMLTLGRDQVLLIAKPPLDECKDVEYQELGNGSTMRKIKDSSIVYRFDGQALTKLFRVAKNSSSSLEFTRSGNDVLMSLLMPQHTLYRYSDGKIEKILTIDYGEMEKPEPETKIETMNDVTRVSHEVKGNYSEGCYHPQLKGSALAFWHQTRIDMITHTCLAIATPEEVRNYEPRISGLNIDFDADMITVDNGTYTMLIQGDWENIINANEELSETGKRIIEAMKGNDDNPVILQFKLKL